MAASRLYLHADLLNRCNSLLFLRITKVVNNGRNNLKYSGANYCTSTVTAQETNQPVEEKRVNRAVQAYLRRTEEYETFIKQQTEEYHKGKKFLARIMGENTDNFTQRDVDEAIEYLFPTGLYEPKAKPMMKHPSLLFAERKAAQFNEEGRPYHFLFYTTKPKFSEVLHNCAVHLENLNEKLRNLGPGSVHPKVPLSAAESEWLSKPLLEKKLLENLLDQEYEKFLEAMERLLSHPYSFEVASFIMQYRSKKSEKVLRLRIPKTETTDNGVKFVHIKDSRRKRCHGEVKLMYPGTGKLTINGKNLIDTFEHVYSRQEGLKSDMAETVPGVYIPTSQSFTSIGSLMYSTDKSSTFLYI